MRVHTAFDLLTGRLAQIKETDNHEDEHLEVFDLQKGEYCPALGNTGCHALCLRDEAGQAIGQADHRCVLVVR